MNYKDRIVTDVSKPDGVQRKLIDVGRLTNMGWTASVNLDQGIRDTYRWFLENHEGMRF